MKERKKEGKKDKKKKTVKIHLLYAFSSHFFSKKLPDLN